MSIPVGRYLVYVATAAVVLGAMEAFFGAASGLVSGDPDLFPWDAVSREASPPVTRVTVLPDDEGFSTVLTAYPDGTSKITEIAPDDSVRTYFRPAPPVETVIVRGERPDTLTRLQALFTYAPITPRGAVEQGTALAAAGVVLGGVATAFSSSGRRALLDAGSRMLGKPGLR